VFEAEPEACALRHVEALEVGDGARCDLAVQVLLIHEVRHADMLLLEAQALLVGRREDAVIDDERKCGEEGGGQEVGPHHPGETDAAAQHGHHLGAVRQSTGEQ
jgi:hypothetical protein